MKEQTIYQANRESQRLPTSRYARGSTQSSAFAILRDLMPKRALTGREAEQIAALQAHRLLELAGIRSPAVPTALIGELPRIQVVSDPDLPSSGTAVWVSGRWLIMVNSCEPAVRQRWTLAHELKHCLDHRYQAVVYPTQLTRSSQEQSERAADAFAAALLLPKPWVVRAWVNGHQRLDDLCQLFQVSPEAMSKRLNDLGLTSAGEPVRSQGGVYAR
jgi:hypothetical protein